MPKKRFTILFDLRRCNGCYACQVACKAEHNIPLGVFRIRVNTFEYGEYPEVKRVFIPTVCAQAGANSPLLKACSDGSVTLDTNGIIRNNDEKPSFNLKEIKELARSDPYGGAFLHPYKKNIDFCDYCTTTRDINGGENPACAITCNTEAIYFGDINDPQSVISHYIKKWDGKVWKGEKVRVARLKGSETPSVNVLYMGLTPEIDAIFEGHKQFDPTFLEIQRWKEKAR